MKKTLLIFAVLACAFSATAYAALNNDNKTIHMVDVMASERLYIHFEESLSSRPACSDFTKIAACDLNQPWCQQVSRMALAAQLAGKKVELSLNGQCIGNVAEIGRFRVK